MSVYLRIWAIVLTVFVILAAHGMCQAQAAPSKGLAPWGSNTDPTDKAKRHVEQITAGKHDYSVTQGGTMDGYNCTEPVGVWHAWKQLWESNRQVRMENVGDTDVVNPWLSNGRNDFRTIKEIIESATEPGMSDAERAIAIWYQQTRYRWHHAAGGAGETGDPVKLYNVRGYSACGDDSTTMAGLWLAAGFEVHPAHLLLHCISQVGYDGGWHLMDGDMHTIYLKRDNKTVASEQELGRDHDLIKRTRVYGLLTSDSHDASEREAAQYVYEGEPAGSRRGYTGHSMNMVLRPGEALLWRWGNLDPLKYHGKSHPRRQVKSDDWKGKICNGLWEYRPDLTKDLWRKGTVSVDSVVGSKDGIAPEAGKTGTIVWKIQSPYVFVGARIEVEGKGARFSHSFDGKRWQEVELDESMDWLFPPKSKARYNYYLRCQLPEGAQLKSLAIINDLEMAPLALPGMVVGKNGFVYTDESPDKRSVRITHEWVERSSSKPPPAPVKPTFPPDGGESNGSDIVFKWPASVDPDGDRIADYHFELSDRQDMKWPLSPNFAKLISRTRDRRKAQYTLPLSGMLTPDTKYYWHVRARDNKGVWGSWSKTWSFTARCVAYPVDVTLEYDKERNIGTLRWKPNPLGRRPAKYRVYGSNEKGFSISDKPYRVNVGVHKGELSNPFPANFVAETDKPELVVVGVGLAPNANKTYYRVVAVDKEGKRSWSSDFVTGPRPVIYTKPVLSAKVGQAYSYQVSAIRSIGDLGVRGGKKSFLDIEQPKFVLKQSPEWLKIDPATGVLSGTPDAPGKEEVVVTATVDTEVRILDLGALQWGKERVADSRIERVGRVTQKFVIEVGK